MKENYRIPVSIGESALDVEIAITGKSGVGLRPMPVGYILVWMASGLGLMWAVFDSFMKASPLWLKALFCLVWILITWLLLRRDELGQQMWVYLEPALEYVRKASRRLGTRRTEVAWPLRQVVGVVHIDDHGRTRGRMTYADGSYGYLYEVVGNGSRLLFEADKAAIIDRYDAFWRKFDTGAHYDIISTKAPMRVDKQVGAMVRRYRDCDDEALRRLIDAKYKVLRGYVGDEFRSTHQYLLVRAENKEALRRCVTHVLGECENSSLVFKRVEVLDTDEILSLLRSIYTG